MPLFYQSALRREQHEDITPSFRLDSSEKGLTVVMFCSDLRVKRCEGDRAFTFATLALVLDAVCESL